MRRNAHKIHDASVLRTLLGCGELRLYGHVMGTGIAGSGPAQSRHAEHELSELVDPLSVAERVLTGIPECLIVPDCVRRGCH